MLLNIWFFKYAKDGSEKKIQFNQVISSFEDNYFKVKGSDPTFTLALGYLLKVLDPLTATLSKFDENFLIMNSQASNTF